MTFARLIPLALALAPLPAAAQIVRHTGDAKAIILQGVTVPAGAETLYLSGMLAAPLDPAKPGMTIEAYGDTKAQAASIFTKMKALLAAKGYAMGDVIKLTVFVVADPKLGKMDFAGFNDAYKMFFGTAEQPNLVARSTVQVSALAAPQFLIEIEATAAKAPAAKR